MKHMKVLSLFLLATCLFAGGLSAQAQTTQTEMKEEEPDLETQLYLIVGTNQDVADAKVPAVLEAVIKQLRGTLPFKNYRLAATLINRVKNEGRLSISGVGAPLVSTAEAGQPTTRSSFQVRQIKLMRNREGQSMVQWAGFSFNAQIPVQTNAGAVADNKPAPPIFNYEGASLGTDISAREGEPVIVGTLNVGASGDAVILVLSARRTTK